MNKLLPPDGFEPMKKNRFLVLFPDEFEIHPIFVRTITLPKQEIISVAETSYFTVKFTKKIKMSDCFIELMPTYGDNLLKKLFNIQSSGKVFDFTIQILDPIGFVVNEYIMTSSIINEIVVETLDYKCDEPINYKVRLSIDKFIIL